MRDRQFTPACTSIFSLLVGSNTCCERIVGSHDVLTNKAAENGSPDTRTKVFSVKAPVLSPLNVKFLFLDGKLS